MYLNPIICTGLLGLRTLVCKLVGVVLSMAGGLIAGKEGPFVHAGVQLRPGLTHSVCRSPLYMTYECSRSGPVVCATYETLELTLNAWQRQSQYNLDACTHI